MTVRTQKAAAAALKITARQLRDWEKEPWWPPNAKTGKGYNVDVIRQARDAMGRKGSERHETAAAIKLATDAEKLKQHRVKTQQLELALEIRKAELFPRDGIELFISTFLTAVGDDLDQLPAMIVKAVPAKFRKRLDSLIRSEVDDMRRKWRADLEREARERDLSLSSALGSGAA